jgi:uncharacterized membrane protein YtjA (UPF0391 family)
LGENGEKNANQSGGGKQMLNWALAFLVIAIVAGLLGFTGVVGIAVEIAWILFIVGLILLVVYFVTGRRSPPPM